MTDLKDIQELQRDTIAAGPEEDPTYFSNESVIADDGLQGDAIEAALNNRGFVVIVDLPREPKTVADHPGVTHQQWCCPVWIQLNPQANATGAQKNILEAVQKVYSALFQYSDADQAEKFESDDENPGDLFVNDAGTQTYLLRFHKLVALS